MKVLEQILLEHNSFFHPVVPFNPGKDKLLPLDFTQENKELTEELLSNTDLFTAYINSKLQAADARYGIGGYGEHRTIYSRSEVFGPTHPLPHPQPLKGSTHAQKLPDGNTQEGRGQESMRTDAPLQGLGVNEAEPRRLHLGVDIWGKPNTHVMAPLDGFVHSFAFHQAFGDYGAVIILSHQLDGLSFYTLYGHLSLASIKNLHEGDCIRRGEVFAEFGIPQENGNWPPHLHFQIIKDLEGMKGDYPGVCRYSEKERYLFNCPDPDFILNMKQYGMNNE